MKLILCTGLGVILFSTSLAWAQDEAPQARGNHGAETVICHSEQLELVFDLEVGELYMRDAQLNDAPYAGPFMIESLEKLSQQKENRTFQIYLLLAEEPFNNFQIIIEDRFVRMRDNERGIYYQMSRGRAVFGQADFRCRRFTEFNSAS